MEPVLLVKLLHILGATVFLGTGAGTAWVKMRADRSGEVPVIVWAHRHVVHADLVFTIPAGIVMPVTGAWLVDVFGYWKEGWVHAGFAGWALAGVFWLPAWRLQYRMLALAEEALAKGTPLSPEFHRATRWWALLGVPSFGVTVVTIWMMVSHRTPW